MEVVSIVVVALVSFFIVPIFLLFCLDKKDSDDSEPKLGSFKKKSGSRKNSKRASTHSADSTKSKSKTEENALGGDVVIANGSVQAAYEEVGPSSQPDADVEGNTYEEPEALLTVPQQITTTVTTTHSGAVSNGTNGVAVTVVNETSPSNSQRSSNVSNGQPRVTSLDRALPDIPIPNLPPARQSMISERSPSTKRALPDLPPPTVEVVEDDGSNLYDQLERDMPAHQIKAKGSTKSTSDSAALTVNMRQPQNQSVSGFMAAEDDAGSDLIVPDEITRSSMFVTANDAEQELYSVVGGDDTVLASSEVSTPSTSTTPPNNLNVKAKPVVKYTKVNKRDSGFRSEAEPATPSTVEVPEDPVYMEAPPVPDKKYDLDEGSNTVGVGGAAASAGVMLVVDENAQDSGSGYSAVTDLESAAQPSSGDIDLPENYNILSGRESIATVMSRQSATPSYPPEEDHYEAVDVDDQKDPAPQAAMSNHASEIYAEIDNQPSTSKKPLPSGASNHPPSSARHIMREELYAEIEDAPKSQKCVRIGNPTPNFRFADPGYEQVDCGEAKGEQTDSAGYAIVKGASQAGAAPPSNIMNVDDDEDYAVCDPPGLAQSALSGVIARVNINTRPDTDSSDYSTVTVATEGASSTNQQSVSVPAAAATAEASVPAETQRPHQNYRRKEHVYQDIDEVRDKQDKPEKPPDKNK